MIIAGLGNYTIIYYLFHGDKIRHFRKIHRTFRKPFIPVYIRRDLSCGLDGIENRKEKSIFDLHVDRYFWICHQIPVLQSALALADSPCRASDSVRAWRAFHDGGRHDCRRLHLDELENGQRREATFGAIYWFMVKLGTAVALACQAMC